MTRIRIQIITAAICILGFITTYGEMNFNMEHLVPLTQYSSFQCSSSHHTTNKLIAFDWGIFPPMWFIAPFFTNYAGHGWSLGANPDCAFWESIK